MAIMTKELSDGRFVGSEILEIVAFPESSFSAGREQNAAQNAQLFRRLIQELHAVSAMGNTCFELLWLTEHADKQAFQSHVRVFFVMRHINSTNAAVNSTMHNALNSVITVLRSQNYQIEEAPFENERVKTLLGEFSPSSVCALIKSEKFAGNSLSPYPYYSCDVLPEGNEDNFKSLVDFLSHSNQCGMSFQLFPTAFSQKELMAIAEQDAILGRIASGYFNGRQQIQDEAAVLPKRVCSYYNTNGKTPLFQYNILTFGQEAQCRSLAEKVRSLLRAGASPIATCDCTVFDLTREKIDIEREFLLYPWNINNKLIYSYRNKRVLQAIPTAGTLFRLPYIVTAGEAAAFFRLPLKEDSMTALKSTHAKQTQELFRREITAEDNIVFGKLSSSPEMTIGCPPANIARHALIVGMPGSGKTTFSLDLLLQLARKGVPFLAIEPTKTEYRAMIDAIPDLQVFTPGNNEVSPFILNPFLPPKGVKLERYIPSLNSAFQAAFSMPTPLDSIFPAVIRSTYMKYGWTDFSQSGDENVIPFGLHEFIRNFKDAIAKSTYSSDVSGNIQAGGLFRLMNLIEQNSNIYDTIHTLPIEDILSKPTVIELNAIDNTEQKSLLIALLLIQLCAYIKSNRQSGGELINALLIDEAHVLLKSKGASETKQDAASEAIQNMIAEMRAYGLGILIADQTPSDVGKGSIANTDIKVAFRVIHPAEKELIAGSMNMDDIDKQKLSALHPGEAYVYYSLLESPQFIITKDIRKANKIRLSVSDKEVAAKTTYWNNHRDWLKPFGECKLCQECKNGCDFKLRASADSLAERLYEKNGQKIKDITEMKCVMVQFKKMLGKILDVFPIDQQQRVLNCTKIRFARKMELQRGIVLTTKELATVLLPEND